MEFDFYRFFNSKPPRMARRDRLNLYKELLDERGEMAVSDFTREFEVSAPTA